MKRLIVSLISKNYENSANGYQDLIGNILEKAKGTGIIQSEAVFPEDIAAEIVITIIEDSLGEVDWYEFADFDTLIELLEGHIDEREIENLKNAL